MNFNHTKMWLLLIASASIVPSYASQSKLRIQEEDSLSPSSYLQALMDLLEVTYNKAITWNKAKTAQEIDAVTTATKKAIHTLDKITKFYTTLPGNLQKKFSTLKITLIEDQKKRAVSIGEIASLRGVLSEIEDKLKDKTPEAELKQSKEAEQVEKLAQELKQVKEQLKAAQVENSTLKTAQKEAQESASESIKTAQAEAAQATEKLAQTEEQTASQRNIGRMMYKKLESNKTELATLHQKLQECENKLQASEGREKVYAKRYHEATDTINRQQEQLRVQQQQINVEQEALNTARDSFMQKNQALQEKITAQQVEYQAIIGNAKQQVQEKDTIIEELRKKLLDKSKEYSKAYATEVKLERELRTTERESKDRYDQIQKLGREIETLKKRINILEARRR